MRTRIPALALALALTIPVSARGQEPARPRQPAQPDQAMRLQRMQETATQMERLMSQIRETNQWMTQQHACDACLQMGQNMEQAAERLHVMLQQMDRLNNDPHIQGDRARLREVDTLHERLRDMIQQMDQARDALRHIAGGP
jgi:hypothetical protein